MNCARPFRAIRCRMRRQSPKPCEIRPMRPNPNLRGMATEAKDTVPKHLPARELQRQSRCAPATRKREGGAHQHATRLIIAFPGAAGWDKQMRQATGHTPKSRRARAHHPGFPLMPVGLPSLEARWSHPTMNA